jgi:hypothetical protein
MKKLPVMMLILTLMATTTAQTNVLRESPTIGMAAQSLSSTAKQDRIVVRHLHDSGWTSHPVELLLTSDKLFIHANQEYRDNNGYTRYCTFPAEIPLEHIVIIEAKLGTTAFWGIYKITKLNLQYIDEKGKQHEYDFLSQNAIQTNGQWSEGVGRSADLRQFAQSVQKAISARTEELKRSETAHPQPQNMQFNVLTIGKSGLSPATVSILPDSATLHIAWQGSDAKDDISLDEILTIEVKQRRLSLKSDDPDIIFEINVGVPYGPKLYVLELTVSQSTGKPFIYRIASDEAVCNGTDPCRDGQDDGKHLLELAQAIKAAMAMHTAAANQAAVQKEAYRAQPAALITTLSFDDSQSFLPDQRLDAGKKADLVVGIANQGPGPAIDVTVNISSTLASLKLAPPQSVGEIPPGGQRTVRAPIEVGLDITGSEANVVVNVGEKRGFDARPVTLKLPVAKLEPPALSIIRTDVNDGNSGLADGNGNGIPENGETFELQVLVRNDGRGLAAGVTLSAGNWPQGIEVVRASSDLGVVQPGQSVLGILAFAIPRVWSGSSLSFVLNVRDGRGESVASVSKQVTLPKSK